MGKIYGYCRISTQKQSIDRQETNIRQAFPQVFKIYKEAYSGRSIARPEWNKLIGIVEAGDTIVFDEVSRMSRNAKEGFEVYKELYRKGINLVFLKERHVNTDSYKEALNAAINVEVNSGDRATDELIASIMQAINRFMEKKLEQDIYSAFASAQMEVDYLRERTKEGIREAKKRGKTPGRRAGEKVVTKKSIESKKQILKYCNAFYGTNTDAEVIKIIGISRGSYFKYKRELKALFLPNGLLRDDIEEKDMNIVQYAKIIKK